MRAERLEKLCPQALSPASPAQGSTREVSCLFRLAQHRVQAVQRVLGLLKGGGKRWGSGRTVSVRDRQSGRWRGDTAVWHSCQRQCQSCLGRLAGGGDAHGRAAGSTALWAGQRGAQAAAGRALAVRMHGSRLRPCACVQVRSHAGEAVRREGENVPRAADVSRRRREPPSRLASPCAQHDGHSEDGQVLKRPSRELQLRLPPCSLVVRSVLLLTSSSPLTVPPPSHFSFQPEWQ